MSVRILPVFALLCAIFVHTATVATTTTTEQITSAVTTDHNSGQEVIKLLGAGASLPSNVFYEWLALYSYSRLRQPTESVEVVPSYTTYDSSQGAYVMISHPHVYQYGASEIDFSHYMEQLNPSLTQVPVVAG